MLAFFATCVKCARRCLTNEGVSGSIRAYLILISLQTQRTMKKKILIETLIIERQLCLIFSLMFFTTLLFSTKLLGQQVEIEWDGTKEDVIRLIEGGQMRFAIEGHTAAVTDRVTFKIRSGDTLINALTLYEGGTVRLEKVDTILTGGTSLVRKADGTLGVRQYKVGDVAHGGIVFWVDETGEHGLVCSQADLESTAGDFTHEWSAAPSITGASAGFNVPNGNVDGKGAGVMNTILIISSDRADGDSAARLCANFIEGSYGDWYLPSKGELHLIYSNLHLAGLGNFAVDNNYWSSTESVITEAVSQWFGVGSQDDDVKTNTRRVRAIRAF